MSVYPELAESLLKTERIVRELNIINICIRKHGIDVHMRESDIGEAPGEATVIARWDRDYDKIIKEHEGITYFALRPKS